MSEQLTGNDAMIAFKENGRRGALVFLICALFVDFGAAVAATAAPSIVYPPDRALLSGAGDLEVRGFLPGAAGASLSIAGKKGPHAQPVPAGVFSVKVKLEPGENTLTLQDRKITVFLAAATGGASTPGFSPPDPHAADNDCTECHAVTATAVTLLEKPPALCARCHDDVLKGKDGKPQPVLHPPAQEGDCLSCHVFHRLSIKALAPAAKREVCFGCHDDFTAGGKKRMHRPVALGECTGCHSPHAAPGKSLLPATGIKLCLLCHADPSLDKAGAAWTVAHPALDDGCASCHLHHVSDAPRLLKKPVAQVCADCHDPFPTEQQGRALVRHSPVEEGDCVACHGVHGSNEKKLLVAAGKALCLKCHDDPSRSPEGKDWATPHPALDDGCGACHLPHVAPAAGLLKKDQALVCADCHDPFSPPAEGAGGSIHRPVAQGGCSLCHAPHGSATAKLLAAAPARALCLKCHKDPALDAAGAEWAVPHPALDDGCPTCHRPHVSDSPRLLAKPQAQVCAGCHEDKSLDGEGQAWSTPHPPVAAGLCSSCHGAHGGKEKALLVKPGFESCMTCHTEVHARHTVVELNQETGQPKSEVTVLPPGFPVRKRDGMLSCLGCHQPHGSDNPRLWPVPETNFCAKCHTVY